MSVIDQALKANELYAKTYDPKWGEGPQRPQIVVVTCMDPRLSDLPGILGLKHADIDVIRTGGPNVTEDVLALVVSTRVLGSVPHIAQAKITFRMAQSKPAPRQGFKENR